MNPDLGSPSDSAAQGPARTGAILDATNQQLLLLLTHKGRSTIREMADHVGRTESTVRDRVASLERHGIVTGYRARVDWGLAGYPMLVLFEGRLAAGDTASVAAHLASLPEVEFAITTTGVRNLSVLVRTHDITHALAILRRFSQEAVSDLHARIAVHELVAERQPRQLRGATVRLKDAIPAQAKPPPLALQSPQATPVMVHGLESWLRAHA